MRISTGAALLITGLLLGCSGGEPGPPSAAPPGPHEPDKPVRTWPGFRGPTGDGVAAAGARIPVDLDPAADMLWKTPLPAAGYSSPIVWGDRVFLTGEGHRIMAFDADSGELLWDTALEVPPEPPLGEDEWPFEPGEYGTASPTPCTDGQRVYAFFNTGVIGCVDMTGEPQWVERLIVRPPNIYGLSASTVVHDGTVVQVIDLDADELHFEPRFRSFVVGLRAADGKELWRQSRPVYPSWSSPLLIPGEQGAELITSAEPWVIAYDPANGEELWRLGGVAGEIAASPIAGEDYVYAFGDPTGSILAIRRGRRGELNEDAVAWSFAEDVPEVPSAVLAGEHLVFIGATDRIRAIDADTGRPKWSVLLPDMVYASPVFVAGKLLVIDTKGIIRIIDPTSGRVEHEVGLGEPVSASPAVVGERLYIRGHEHLMSLGRRE